MGKNEIFEQALHLETNDRFLLIEELLKSLDKPAEAKSKAKRLEREAEMDYDLDRIAMQNMDKTWKDELILLIWLTPVVMSFVPEWQPYVIAGFASLALVPDWYMYILVGLVTVIYGMRGMLKMVLQIVGSKFKIKKDKE